MALLNELGTEVIPEVFDLLKDEGITDTMTVKRKSASAGTGGGRVKGSTSDAYTSVPVDVQPYNGTRFMLTDKPIANATHLLEFPVYDTGGTRITVNPATDRFVVDARGSEPAKTFRIITSPDDHGITYKAYCELEV